MLKINLTRGAAMQIGRMGAVAIAKAVASCSSLQKLELDENQISEDGVAHLKVCLSPFTYSVPRSQLYPPAAD